MRANKIKVEYLVELLENMKVVHTDDGRICWVCKETRSDLLLWAKKEMKKEGWD